MSSSKYYKVNLSAAGKRLRGPKRIPGYENYLADSKGRIYVTGRGGRLRQLTQFLAPNSRYLRVYLTKNRVKKNLCVHNLVISAYRNCDPDKIIVKHMDCNSLNNKLVNLRLNGAVPFERNKRIYDYRIECMEESLREKTGYGSENGIWEKYMRIKKNGSARTVINWLKVALKDL